MVPEDINDRFPSRQAAAGVQRLLISSGTIFQRGGRVMDEQRMSHVLDPDGGLVELRQPAPGR